jgi:hypothetical protein
MHASRRAAVLNDVVDGCASRIGLSTYLRFVYVIAIIVFIWFLAGFRPNLGPRPAPTGRARKMVRNAPTISPGDRF